MRTFALLGPACAALAGCGYPDFQYAAGVGGSSVSNTTAASASSTGGGAGGSVATSSSSSMSSSGGGAGCVEHVVLSEVRTRGSQGGADEFVELYNPTNEPVTLTKGAWEIKASPAGASPSYGSRWISGSLSSTVPAHGHYLVAGMMFDGSTEPDDFLTTGISDAGSVVLYFNGQAMDAICFTCPSSTTFGTGFTCSDERLDNSPHDNSASGESDVDKSLARSGTACPLGAFGPTTVASTPENSTSPPGGP